MSRWGRWARLRAAFGPAAACCLLLAACCSPGNVKTTVKIGLSAPFEGRDRDLGYEVLHAVRLAVRQRNAAGGIGERFLVEIVALNDMNEADEAIVQAHKMSVDSGVLGVIGGWSPAVAAAAAPEFESLDLAFLEPPAAFSPGAEAVEVPFAAEYQALSGGVPPGPAAAWAYQATRHLLDALEAAARAEGKPTRAGVLAALAAQPQPS